MLKRAKSLYLFPIVFLAYTSYFSLTYLCDTLPLAVHSKVSGHNTQGILFSGMGTLPPFAKPQNPHRRKCTLCTTEPKQMQKQKERRRRRSWFGAWERDECPYIITTHNNTNNNTQQHKQQHIQQHTTTQTTTQTRPPTTRRPRAILVVEVSGGEWRWVAVSKCSLRSDEEDKYKTGPLRIPSCWGSSHRRSQGPWH